MFHRSAFQSLIRPLSRIHALMTLMVICALLVTAVAFMAFTQKEVTSAMLGAGDENARNVLRVIMLNMEELHGNIDFFKGYARKRYEDQLRNLVSVVVSQVDYYHGLYRKGLLSEDQARRAALEAVESTRYGKNDYFFIYDRRNIAVSHPDPNTRGRDLSNFKDIHGRYVLKTMQDMTKQKGDGFCTLWWTRLGETKPVPKLLYFFRYEPWDWLIGTGLYIDDIDADVEGQMTQVMQMLTKTFDQVRVAETGYFTLFTGEKKILIHPLLSGTEVSALQGAVSGTDHFGRLIAAAKNPAVPLKYFWDKPNSPGQYRFTKYSHVEHFKPFDWYISSSVYEDEMKRPAQSIIRRQMLFVAVVVLLCIMGSYMLVSLVTRPLARLAEHAKLLQKADFSLPEATKQELLSIRYPYEVARLSGTMWNMERRLDEYLQNIRETTAARERLESELRIAREIQMSMLPRVDPVLAGRKDIDLAARLEPARNVGGDLYDFFFIDGERICLLIGDVSDKGVPAALFMARSKALLHHAALNDKASPQEILETVNGELAEDNDLMMFITVFLGILNVRTGELVFSNAGHLPPLLLAADGSCRTLELPPGRPLGISPHAGYAERRIVVDPDDALVMYTDGITEAMDRDGRLFGEERLTSMHRKEGRPGSAEAVVDAMFRTVNAFSSETSQSDDMAVLCIRRTGPALSPQAENPAG